MTARRLLLYVRSRYLVTSFAVMVGSAGGVWALGPHIEDPYRHHQLLVLAAALTVVALAPGLRGADVDLDRVAGFAWPPRRAAHVIAGGAVAVGLLALAVHGSALITAGWVARDIAGLAGLLGLGVALLGAGRGPVLCLLWTAVAVALAPVEPPPACLVVIAWMVQPTDATAATVTAVVLAVAGVLAYSLAGPRR